MAEYLSAHPAVVPSPEHCERRVAPVANLAHLVLCVCFVVVAFRRNATRKEERHKQGSEGSKRYLLVHTAASDFCRQQEPPSPFTRLSYSRLRRTMYYYTTAATATTLAPATAVTTAPVTATTTATATATASATTTTTTYPTVLLLPL